ncbi:hypothetical protein SAMN05444008_102390 [Cnuella takakiae]|uniref:Uncharacterized protein n=1 Tax=Cnuella takakiae TaxID=1302690 RepID=A0A1M4VUI2_9BACT|nr:hypothetical protein [Cnuella takakiae]OLY92492.1 hypothetical protein BUE76_11785 [Cnuella takakiae]SHE72694.1 hypothetical protein SAMN05444008_102390 [Cnuella takakiae]
MQASSSYGRKQLLIIGKALAFYQPDLAAQMLADNYLPPVETDLSKLPLLLEQFKQAERTAQLSTDQRRVFIGIALRLYKPHLYTVHRKLISAKDQSGFSIALAKLLAMKESNVSVAIRQVIFWEQTNFEGMGERVQRIMAKMKGGEVGST